MLVLCFLPETKELSQEELDQVFWVPTRRHAAFQLRQVPWFFQKYVLRREVGEQERLYHWESSTASADDDVPEKAEHVKSDYVERNLAA